MVKSIARILESLRRELVIAVSYVDAVREGFVYSVENTELGSLTIRKVWAMKRANHVPAHVSLALVKLIYVEKAVNAQSRPQLREVRDWLSSMQMIGREFGDVHLIIERNLLAKILAKYDQMTVEMLSEEAKDPSEAFFDELAERQNGFNEAIGEALKLVDELYVAVRDESRELTRV